MEFDGTSIQDHIPSYLTQASKDNLVKYLSDFPRPIPYYADLFPEAILQGDGWTELGLIQYETADRKQVKGMILSNSCDIDSKNEKDRPPKLVFVPIVKMKSYAEQLERAGIPRESIEEKFNAIRAQKVTTIFYLPQGASLEDEYIAILDDVHAVPFNRFTSIPGKTKLFTLSQVGFYLFLLKLSVHFCRFHEELQRN